VNSSQKPRIRNAAALIGVAISAFIFSVPAHAMTVTGVPPYASSTTTAPFTFDFAGDVNPIAAGAVGIDPNYHFFNFNSSAADGGNANDMILFDVSVSPTQPSSGATMLMVFNTVTQTYLPIAAAGLNLQGQNISAVPPFCWQNAVNTPGTCEQVNGGNQSPNTTSGSAGAYPGVDVADTTGTVQNVRIGLYLRDMCKVASGSAACTAAGSSNGAIVYGTTPLILNLSFQLVSSTSQAYSTSPIDSQTVTVNLHKDGMTIGCSNIEKQSPYFPGDGSITVDATQFQYTTNATSASLPTNLVVVAGINNEFGGGVPILSTATAASNYATAYSPVGTVAYNSKGAIGPFTNSDTEPGTKYSVAFTWEDGSGLVGSFQSDCVLIDVQTSSVLGFLKKNSCFIATGAFRSDSDWPILLLRQFRDNILNHYSLGRKFRDWYYSWSPDAGWWLLENPEFRYPVLRALLPLQLVVFVLLKPLLAIALLCAGFGVFCYAAVSRIRQWGRSA
jgi:hypothetical protein